MARDRLYLTPEDGVLGLIELKPFLACQPNSWVIRAHKNITGSMICLSFHIEISLTYLLFILILHCIPFSFFVADAYTVI
jgi:hypothetical protein